MCIPEQLAKSHPEFKSVRFFGKILARNSDYFVAECEMTVNLLYWLYWYTSACFTGTRGHILTPEALRARALMSYRPPVSPRTISAVAISRRF